MSFQKIIQSGAILESFDYTGSLSERSPFIKRSQRIKRFSSSRRIDNVRRLSSDFRRLIQSNLLDIPPLFITLTFSENVDIKQGFYELGLFHQRLRYSFGSDFKYIIVPEFGSRSTKRLHFHALYWGLPLDWGSIVDLKTHEVLFCGSERSTRLVATLWGNGWVDIIQTDNSIKLSSYMAKYMQKALFNPLLLQQKAYVCSRNIKRPVIMTSSSHSDLWGVTHFGWNISFVLETLGFDDSTLTKKKEFDTLYLGRCLYKKYNNN